MHSGIVWEGDSLPLAAARQMLFGETIYRDIWYDKPPLVAIFHLLDGTRIGWPLRLLDALYAWLVCLAAWRLARDLWGEREGLFAAGLSAFFLVFDFPATVIPAASDFLLVAPHFAAVWLAWKRRPLLCGIAAGIGFWASPKAAFVLAACALWNLPGIPWMLAGFAATIAGGALALAAAGALPSYWLEVFEWGRAYAASPFEAHPLWNGVVRSLGWLGFHVALCLGAGAFLWKNGKPRWLWLAWIALAFAGLSAGMRFFPRYYFLLFPPFILMASRGFSLLGRRTLVAAGILLLIPFARFAPTYWYALHDAKWRDTAMDRDSRDASRIVRSLDRSGDTLFVWGYRPEIYLYTDLPAATMYLDSQPLTGIPADRHLTQSTTIDWPSAAKRRAELAQARPSFILDGIGLFNPRLAITRYPDLAGLMDHYREAGHTAGTVIYRLVR